MVVNPSFTHTAITTVGYGEITPRSFLGKMITLPLLVFGLLLIALPSFVLGREFSLVWEEMTRTQNDDSPEHPDSPTLSRSESGPLSPQDLSNFKLAQNQTELSKQIEDLKATVVMQGKMMHRLLEMLDGKNGDGELTAE